MNNDLLIRPFSQTGQRRSQRTVALAQDASWQGGLPELSGAFATLRELATRDAADLLPLLSAPEVSRFLSPPPVSVERFAWFIEATRREREAGRYAGFAIVPHGGQTAVGLVQLRSIEPGFQTAEWGVALGASYWGRGLFMDAAHLLLSFAFDTIGAHRLEARVAVPNARGNAALDKLGAVQEGVLRRSLATADGSRFDQVLWSILDEDWQRQRNVEMELPSWVH
jgi:RimJ/RimL family protein N-acetyltransferase